MRNVEKLLMVLIVLFSLNSFAAGEREVISKANKAYNGGFYADAAATYKKVLESGYESPELYYNLGNSYFKMSDYARAILYYEKARKMDPANDDINFNLQVANTKIADKIEPIPELFYKRWFRAGVELFSMDGWAKAGVIFFIGALVLIIVYFVSNVLVIRKIGFWGGIGTFFIALMCIYFAYAGYEATVANSEGIVMAPTVTVKSSPDEKSIDLFVLHEGTKVQLIDNIGIWYEIRIANGSVGWLPVTSFEKI